MQCHERNIMTKPEQTNPDAAQRKGNVEGEGSYTSTQRYNDRLQKHIADEDVEAQGQAAKKALEGDERKELEDAERRAKRGPAPARPEPSQR
jgi:hypothetical protein